MSSVWKELGAESIIKSFEYHRRRRQSPPKRLCNELLAVMLPYVGMSEVFQRALDAAEFGDETELNRLAARGTWASFLDGYCMGKPIEEYSYANRYILAIEAALMEPVRWIERGDFAEAARTLVRADLTRPLISAEMSFALAAVTSKQRFGCVQWAITLETALSHLAAWSASSDGDVIHESVRDITPFLEDEAGRPRAPGPQFYRLLIRATKKRSMGALVKYLSECEGLRVGIDVQTLKRWSTGKTLPDQGLVKLIVKKCCPEQEERILNMHWVMRYLTLLAHVSETLLVGITTHSSVPGAQEVFAPWPVFPFGCDGFLAWCQMRYPFWYQYHQGRVAAEADIPTAACRTLAT
ncbi:hypothetical protein GPA27_02050 [Aromatoleum toluolicum]|uniref:Uncharacterized protein n=1 Tax=Aromatoleum toluolicum TaxID=90060 RepID=A0ABX1NA66_9RHOO|nr:hypothetical protein [Aromatoleum toluolicum]NMF96178.1 hypothetical protein [Aromatoleum toluolicum]